MGVAGFCCKCLSPQSLSFVMAHLFQSGLRTLFLCFPDLSQTNKMRRNQMEERRAGGHFMDRHFRWTRTRVDASFNLLYKMFLTIMFRIKKVLQISCHHSLGIILSWVGLFSYFPPKRKYSANSLLGPAAYLSTSLRA